MKNFLLLTYFFPPAPLAYSQRVAKLCKYLPQEASWLPNVICGEIPCEIMPGEDKTLIEELPKEITIHRVPSFLSSPLAHRLRKSYIYNLLWLFRKFFIKPDAFGDWISNVENVAQKLFPNGRGIDIILSSGPPNSVYVAGVKLSKKWGIPLVIDMRDPWKQLWGKYIWLKKLFYYQTRKLEKEVYRHATIIITNTFGNLSELVTSFPFLSDKIVMIPNGYDPHDCRWDYGPRLKQPDNNPDAIDILYLGGLRGGGFEEPFFRTLVEFLNEKPEWRNTLKVHFVGASSTQLQNILRPFQLDNVCRAYGVVPANEVGRPLAEADIYLLLLPHSYVKGWIPAKTYYYLAGGKYIFAMVPDGSTKELLLSLPDLAFISKPDPIMGKKVLAQVIEKVRQNRKPPPGDTFPSYALPFDRREIARQVGAVLDRAVNGR